MKKMMAMLLASVMVAGTFATTAFAYTGDDVQKNTSVNRCAGSGCSRKRKCRENGQYRQHRNRPGYAGAAGWL